MSQSTGAIGILHNLPASQGQPFSASSQDVITQVQAVEQALLEKAHPTVRLPFSGEVARLLRDLEVHGCSLVINLCETVNEDPQLAGHPAALLELLGLPFTGSSCAALSLTTDKVLTKRLLVGSGIPTPAFRVFEDPAAFDAQGLCFPVIVKPRFQDASIGIDQDSIFETRAQFEQGIAAFHRHYGSLCVEEYVPGREFNLSLLGYPSPALLAVAEIDFSAFPAHLYPIVGYRAKWDPDSFEYHHTPRTFPEDLSPDLLADLRRAALACFELFGLRDYARVDLRVNSLGMAQVLDINANPCLSPDAGFPATARRTGIDYAELIALLAGFARRRAKKT